MNIFTRGSKVDEMNLRRKMVFYILLFALFINAVIVIFNFLFTCLGRFA